MIKLKVFIDFDKEEKWLNEITSKGLLFIHKGFCTYKFKKTTDVKVMYRIDYRVFSHKSDYLEYLTIFKDAGWNHVSGSKLSGYHYFVSSSGNKNKEIFSDVTTKAARYNRLSKISAMTFLLVLLTLVSTFFFSNTINVSAMANPSSFYYTPGLWEGEGLSFWFSFLLETPFALMRGYGWLLTPALLIVSLYQSVRAWQLSKKYTFQNSELGC